LALDLTDAMVASVRASEQKTAGEEALAALRSSGAALKRERDEAEREDADAADRIEATEAELAAARDRQAECEERAERCRDELFQQRERRQEVRLRLENCGTAARRIHERIRQLEAEMHEHDVALREADVRQESLMARIRDELSLDLAERYRTYEHTEQDWDAVRAEIEELRGKIERLGNVNLDALAELEDLTPRYENLTVQRADLEASVDRLEALIVELDRESRARFTATFEQVRDNFQELFRKLFGGGKADIILEDPQRPLECGIEIIARPPGKEPQSISLLSGGEKTLTAVALLMAVFESKPSPFAFLDEVDAALDEANVERFNTLLQEFLSHSQFVVITHSKRTMQSADALYGVTMEEPGVSQRVSVRFDNRVQAPSVA
jgi:chromosome segregation protein